MPLRAVFSHHSGFGGRTLATLLMVGVLLLATQSSSAADDDVTLANDDPYPSLPEPKANFFAGQYIPVLVGGVQEVSRSKQWIRVPGALQAADYLLSYNADFSHITHDAEVYAIDPLRPKDDDAGYFTPIEVNSVAFGSVPVSYTVHLRQPRGKDGYPVPLKLGTVQSNDNVAGTTTMSGAKLTGELDLRLADVTIDGVPLDVGPNCTTEERVELTLTGKDWQIPLGSEPPTNMGPDNDKWTTSEYYDLIGGGLLEGTVEVPPFKGCVSASGDDMSAVFTAFASGPDNAIRLRQGNFLWDGIGPRCWPVRNEPETCTPEALNSIFPGIMPTPDQGN